MSDTLSNFFHDLNGDQWLAIVTVLVSVVLFLLMVIGLMMRSKRRDEAERRAKPRMIYPDFFDL